MTTAMRRGLLATAAALMAVGLTGCASGTATTGLPAGEGSQVSQEAPATPLAGPLQSYVDAVRPVVEAELERYSDIYSDFSLDAEGSRTLVYRYTFRSQVNPGQARSGIASMDDALEATATKAIFPEMRAAGVDDPVVKWIYYNSDGTVITTLEVPH